MKWLITGANGQLGRCLQQTLSTRGIAFAALSHSDLDITNIALLKESINSIKPDVVVNAAAYTTVEQAEIDSDEAFRINQLGAANVAIASTVTIGTKTALMRSARRWIGALVPWALMTIAVMRASSVSLPTRVARTIKRPL